MKDQRRFGLVPSTEEQLMCDIEEDCHQQAQDPVNTDQDQKYHGSSEKERIAGMDWLEERKGERKRRYWKLLGYIDTNHLAQCTIA